MYISVLPPRVCAYHVYACCLRSKVHIPLNCSYGWLWAVWVLETEPGSLQDQQGALNCWAISPGLLYCSLSNLKILNFSTWVLYFYSSNSSHAHPSNSWLFLLLLLLHTHTHTPNLLSPLVVLIYRCLLGWPLWLDNLLGSLPLVKASTLFLSSHWLPVALHLEVGLCEIFSIHIGMLTVIVILQVLLK